jgi:hypothetical protein
MIAERVRGPFAQAVWHLSRISCRPGAAEVLSASQRLQLLVDLTAGELQQPPCLTAWWQPQHQVLLQTLQQLMHVASCDGQLLPCVQQLAEWLQEQVSEAQQLLAGSMLVTTSMQQGKGQQQQQQQQQQQGQPMQVPDDMTLEELQQLLDALPDHTAGLDAAAGPPTTAAHQQQQQQQVEQRLAATVARVVSVLSCLVPLAGFSRGLMVLSRHAAVLQQAAQLLRTAAQPSSLSADSMLRAAVQAEQLVVAAGVQLQRVQGQYAAAREELQGCLVSVLGMYVGSSSEAAVPCAELFTGTGSAPGTACEETAKAGAGALPAGYERCELAQTVQAGQRNTARASAMQAVRDLAAASSREAALAELLLLAGADY